MPVEIPKSQADRHTGSNHAVSAMKFGIIKKFLMLGWAVLLSDIDICVLQDPFKHLYRYVGAMGYSSATGIAAAEPMEAVGIKSSCKLDASLDVQ